MIARPRHIGSALMPAVNHLPKKLFGRPQLLDSVMLVCNRLPGPKSDKSGREDLNG